MPSVTKRLQERIPSLNGKVAAMTAGPKQTVIVCFQGKNWKKYVKCNEQAGLYHISHSAEMSKHRTVKRIIKKDKSTKDFKKLNKKKVWYSIWLFIPSIWGIFQYYTKKQSTIQKKTFHSNLLPPHTRTLHAIWMQCWHRSSFHNSLSFFLLFKHWIKQQFKSLFLLKILTTMLPVSPQKASLYD